MAKQNRLGLTGQANRNESRRIFLLPSKMMMVFGVLLFLFIGACDNGVFPDQDTADDDEPVTPPVEFEEPEAVTGFEDLLLVEDLEGYLLPVAYDDEVWLINTAGELINSRPFDTTSAMYELFFDHGVEPVLVNRVNPLVMKLEHEGELQAVLFDYRGTLLASSLDANLKHYYNDYGHLVAEEGRYGLAAYSGELLLEKNYDMLEILDGGRYVIFDEEGSKGLFDCAGGTILFSGYEKIAFHGWSNEGLVLAGREGQWVLNTLEGVPLAELDYDRAMAPTEGLAPVRKGDLWGFISIEGETIVEPAYHEIRRFYDGFSNVREGDLWGMINTAGEKVVPAVYEQLYLVYGERPPGVVARFLERKDGEPVWGCFNKTGEPLFNERYSKMYIFKDGFIVDIDDQYALLDPDGRVVLDMPLFDSYLPPEIPGTCNPEAMYVAVGYAMLKRDGLWAVHHDNSLLSEFIFEEVLGWGQPMIFDGTVQMIAREKDQTGFGLYSPDAGDYIIPPGLFEEVHYLMGDRVRVMKDGLYGFVDGDGEMVIDARYDYATSFQHQVAAVIEDGLLSVIDRDGRRLLEPVEAELEEYHWLFVQYIEGPDLYRSVNSSYFNLDGWIRKP